MPALALKEQSRSQIQQELSLWLAELDQSSNLSAEEKDHQREFIFKLRLKTHNKNALQSQQTLRRDFSKSANSWENTLAQMLESDLERGEGLISFLKDYVSIVRNTDDFSTELEDFKNQRLYFDGKKMQRADPRDEDQAGQSAENFLREKETRPLPEWYRLNLSAPLLPQLNSPEPSQTL